MILTNTIKATGNWPGRENLINKSMKTLPHVLLIDDDEIFIFLTRKLLQSSGMVESIGVCRSAFEAIAFLNTLETAEEWPDVILLDLNMPEMNGWEFLQHYQLMIRNLEHFPKLFVLSSSIAANDTERARKLKGVNGYLPKPLTRDCLKQVLDKKIA